MKNVKYRYGFLKNIFGERHWKVQKKKFGIWITIKKFPTRDLLYSYVDFLEKILDIDINKYDKSKN